MNRIIRPALSTYFLAALVCLASSAAYYALWKTPAFPSLAGFIAITAAPTVALLIFIALTRIELTDAGLTYWNFIGRGVTVLYSNIAKARFAPRLLQIYVKGSDRPIDIYIKAFGKEDRAYLADTLKSKVSDVR